MRPIIHKQSAFAVLILVITAMLVAPGANAQDSDDGDNLLQNPGFEQPYTERDGDPTPVVAEDWIPWRTPRADDGTEEVWENRPPQYEPAPPNRVRSGDDAQMYFNNQFWGHEAGVYQVVEDVPPGTELRFSVYAYVWSSTFNDRDVSEQPGDVTLQVGIDPNGGTNPDSSNIVWSIAVEQYDAYRQYSQIATAASDTVTVWVRSRVGFPVQNTYIYLDDANLSPTEETVIFTETPEPTETEQPTETPTPTDTPTELVEKTEEVRPTRTPTPSETVEETEEVQPGVTDEPVQTEEATEDVQPTKAPTLTNTPTPTETETPEPSETPTPTATDTPTPTPEPTDTPTVTPTPTFDIDATPTREGATNTPTPTATEVTPTRTPTETTDGVIATVAPSATPTFTATSPGNGGGEVEGEFLNTLRYTVQRGDTVGRIAALYGSTTEAINRANDLGEDNLIFVGQELLIPVPLAAPATSTPTPTPTPTITPSPTQTPAILPTDAPMQPPAATTYTVRPGDTLNAIAARFNVSVFELAQANGIVNVNRIFPGQQLTIPGTPSAGPSTAQPQPTPTPQPQTTYVVRPGDNLYRISVRFGVTMRRLAEANGIVNVNRIFAGQTLVIP